MSQIVCIHRWESPNEFVLSNDLMGLTASQLRNYLQLNDEKLLITTPLYRKELEPESIPLSEYEELIYSAKKIAKNKYPPTDFNLTVLPIENTNTNSLTISIKTQFEDINFPNMTVDYDPKNCETASDLIDLIYKQFNNIQINKLENFIKFEKVNENKTNEIYFFDEEPVSEYLQAAVNQIKSGEKTTIFRFDCEIQEDDMKYIHRRCSISSEIIDSENNFVADLFQLTQFYEREIKKSKIFDIAQLKFIFDGLKELFDTNKIFFSDLKKVGDDYASEFGAVFLNHVDDFKNQIPFISKYKEVIEMIRKVLLNPSAKAKFEEIKDKDETGKDFLSYYSTPSQRYARYHLLIRDLIKYTPDFHPDKRYLIKALHEIESASFIS